MIVPSVDLRGGHAVQLVGGKEQALDAGDPRPLAERFGRVGPIAVIDLDAALGTGDNAAVIRDLLGRAPCRVGGGIRDREAAVRWLDAGAEQVILGTAARPELLRTLPRGRVVAALDAVDGEVVVDGWRTRTGASVADRMAELRPFVSGFLVTFVEREGRLGGTALDRVPALVAAAGDARLTIAGGVTTADEIAALDRLGCDAQVGMALYTGRMSLAEGFAAALRTDRADGLWPTVVVDELGTALGLCWSNRESLERSLETGRGVYWSRSRGGLWEKGATSGATQLLRSVRADCDRDALRFVVRQAGPGFCHLETRTCWGDDDGLARLARRLAAPEPGGYTRRLLDDPALLASKLREEAGELAAARTPDEVRHEAADVLYFALVACARAGVDLVDVSRELDRRARVVTRRPGDAKEVPRAAED
jgi:phosphoribosyl-ATP pyrophosphohydrolase/phosphoribosyl-AMP cyclohydrolase